jgi:hypothetical protein
MSDACSATNGGWRCPWCTTHATRVPASPAICETRSCGCGAIALAAPPWDSDEIIDDAINIFGIAPEYLTPFDLDRLAGLRHSGVEVRDGEPLPASEGRRFEFRVMWFRRVIRS